MEKKKKHFKATATAAAIEKTTTGVPLQRQHPDTTTELN